MIKEILLVLIGISTGITIGSAAAAFLTLLRLVPRMAQITESNRHIKLFQHSITIGAIIFSFIHFLDFSLKLNKYFAIPVGLIMGTFLGLFSSALAEVLNVIPVFAKKFKLKHELKFVIGALIFGKLAGSLFYWLSFIKNQGVH